ncbi:MAG: NAD(P)-binding protein [Candidatus Diapherotrites archaeon]|nr:NAD(P)-binding protein [Candidatus Diapherotrites archaeon]
MIRIIGAGLSGLACAIALNKNDIETELHEKSDRVGSKFPTSVHAMRGRINGGDTLELVSEKGIELRNTFPVKTVVRYTPSLKKTEERREEPAYYMLLRGEGGVEEELLEQAKKSHVVLSSKEDHGDVIATGPRSVLAVGLGCTFKGSNTEKAHVIYNQQLAPGGYICVLPHKEHTTVLLTCYRREFFDRLNELMEKAFHEIKPLNDLVNGLDFVNRFGGCISQPLNGEVIENPKLIGEAGGFIDPARGFGMHYALVSGALAAEAITKCESFRKLVDETFGNSLSQDSLRYSSIKRMTNDEYEALLMGRGKNS